MKRRNSGLQVRLAGALVLPCCRTLVVTAVLAVTSTLFALPPVQPTLPSVACLDTETVTNVPFAAWQQHLRHFTFKLAFNGTPSNNVEMAFGTDRGTGTTGILPVGGSGVSPLQSGGTGTTGVSPVGGSGVSPLQSGITETGILPVEDGELSPDERDLVVGWDCGAWFVENGATGERITAASAGGCGSHELTVRVRIDHQGTVDDVRFLDNGTDVFAELAASKPSWLYSSSWNCLRLVGRGENVRAGERFFAQITPQGTSVRLR